MTQIFTATFVDGVLKPDEPLALAPGAKFRVTLQPCDEELARKRAAFAELERYRKEHPINSGGLRLTRDQLHERR
jgi:predicted DNA-binding antitoxin AbrB/MazE fold protein